MSISPLTSNTSRPASAEPDRLSLRISNLQTRQRALDREQSELDIERREIARLQREALDDQPRRAAADAPPARQRQTEVENDDGIVIDGIADPAGFAASAQRAAAKARGEKV
jgi:hypothetical protein